MQDFFDGRVVGSDVESQHNTPVWRYPQPGDTRKFCVARVEPLFKKVEDSDIQAQKEKLGL